MFVFIWTRSCSKFEKIIKNGITQRRRKENMPKKTSGKPFKDSSSMKKSKLSLLEKRKLKREKKKNKV